MSKIENISITSASFWNLVRAGRAGDGALTLYLFYVQKAIDQNTIQPKATDEHCAKGLSVKEPNAKPISIKTISRWRKTLQELGLVEHIQKTFKGRKYFYVKVNYLAVTITGKARHFGGTMTTAECNTYVALDYYETWLDRFRQTPRFLKDIADECDLTLDRDTIDEAVDQVWKRISEKGYGISEIDKEHRFYHYVVSSAANEIKSRQSVSGTAQVTGNQKQKTPRIA